MSTIAPDPVETVDLAGPAAEPLRRGRSRRLVLFLVAADVVTLLAVLPLAVLISGWLFGPTDETFGSRPWIFAIPLLVVPFLASYRLYDNDRRRITVSTLNEVFDLFHALSVFGFILIVCLAAVGTPDRTLAVKEVFCFWAAALIALPLTRALMRHLVLPRVSRRQRTVIMGAGRVGQSIARKIAARPDLNLEVVGFLDNRPPPLGADLDGLEVLGREADLVRVVGEQKVERIIISFSRVSHEELLEIIRRSGLEQLYVSIVPRFFEIMASNVEVDDVDGIPVLDLQPVRLTRVALVTKRLVDLTLTALALPFLLPIFAVTAVAIKLDSPGPVFFRQPRMGRKGKVFRIYKFRTMVADAEGRRNELLHLNQVTGPLFKIKADPRVTRVGGFLRRTSVDELPQLINVLKGEMSLVGPRPFVTYEADEIRGWARRRVDLTPGITGAWQVMGRNDMPFDEMVKLDYLYVTNWSLGWDLKLLLQTIPTVLKRQGAY